MIDRIVTGILDGLAVLGALIGGWVLFDSLLAENAMQTAAGAAVGVGFAVVPYCLSGIAHRSSMRRNLRGG